MNTMFEDSSFHVPANLACDAAIREVNTTNMDLEEPKRRVLLCVVLARFDQIRRSGNERLVFEYLLRPLELFDGDPAKLGESLAGENTINDLVRLAKATISDYSDLLKAKSVTVGPIFDQSMALGGADGDLIYDGTLIDFKTSKKATIVNRRDAWQLLGYLLSDTSDQYGIENVEIGAVRWRAREKWTTKEYLDLLSGPAKKPLSAWRTDFAEMLQRTVD